MAETLREAGVLEDGFFVVNGKLVESYNHSLERIVGRKTELEEFRIGMRGESPEIESELGPNYLQCGPASRYAIIVSPDQAHAPLLHEEFTFDHALFGTVFHNYMPSIDIATRLDSLFGEVKDGVRLYRSINDLLHINNVRLNLETPGDFTRNAHTLKAEIRRLHEDPTLLYRDHTEFTDRMVNLFSAVGGDVRNFPITEIEVSLEVATFFTRLFDGVYVFRGEETFEGENNLLGDTFSDMAGTRSRARDIPHEQTHVVYCGDQSPIESPSVKFIPLNKTRDVVKFLLSNGYAVPDSGLVDGRLRRLEDLALIKEGYDVARMSRAEKQRALGECYDSFPEEWEALSWVQQRKRSGADFEEVIRGKRAKNVLPLVLRPAGFGTDNESRVVQHMLTRLWPHDYHSMREVNVRDLEHAYEGADDLTRDYIVSKLKR